MPAISPRMPPEALRGPAARRALTQEHWHLFMHDVLDFSPVPNGSSRLHAGTKTLFCLSAHQCQIPSLLFAQAAAARVSDSRRYGNAMCSSLLCRLDPSPPNTSLSL
ncbi:hypothetical protein CLAIMM_02181 isoform 1 [Cladophialophora immunda]|nr:hypothetical protein CLAIMM_02181 isoform 1 [Cladophialophora immunda]